MHCPNCQAEIPEYPYCPYCGHPMDQEPAAQQVRPEPRPSRAFFSRWVLPLSLLLVLIAFGVLAMSLLGFRDGVRQRELDSQHQAEILFSRGEAYLECGQYQLAEAHFEEALRLFPQIAGGSDQLAVARARQTVTPSPTPPPPTSTPIVPTPTPRVVIVPVAEVLFGEGVAHFEAHEWDLAISKLEQLQVEDLTYESERVTQMLFESHLQYGLALDEEGQIEAAILQYDRALNLIPRHPETSDLRRRADLYQSAINDWDVDWESVVNFLIALYHLAPDYKDTAARLYEAATILGEDLVKQERYCAASEMFEQAVEIDDSDEAVVKREADTAYLCHVTTPYPLHTPTPDGPPSPWQQVHLGTLISTCYDPHDDQYAICAQNAEDQVLTTWVPQAEQPDITLDGRWLAYRSSDTNRAGLYAMDVVSGTVITITNEADAHYPTWSPDGTQVGYTQYDPELGEWFLYIADLTESVQPERIRAGNYPDWGPNNKIAISTCGQENDCGIYVFDPVSSELRKLTSAKQDRAGAWSPSGDEIAYMSDIGLSLNLYVVQAESGHVRQITKNLFTDVQPVWSPDGQRIAFATNHSDDWSIYSIHPWARDGQAERITTIGAKSADWQRFQLAWAAQVIRFGEPSETTGRN